MSKFYVTTSIPYVNGDPHIGFAMELLQADVLARLARARKDDVIFCTGTDEHGTKVAQTAASLGKTPKQFTDEISQKFRDLGTLLNVSNDRFIRTTDVGHIQRAQLIWKQLSKDIYKAKYTGWYDVRQEEFVPEKMVDPARTKPDHPQAYQKLEEENYFFKLSAYTAPVKQAIESGEFKIVPASRRNEILSLLKEGLEDISVSRPKAKLDWGIPVPGDTSQVMYVWFEALMNYITVLGYPEHEDFKNFWPASVQVVGKDISRFHGAIWPAMLMSLGIPLPQTLFVHSFINAEGGEKMSKSLGNVVAPAEIVNKYGVDAFRYYFLRHIPSYEDGEFSWDRFEAAYNNELANELGNAVQRTAAMIMRYQNGLIGEIPPATHDHDAVYRELAECRFDKALALIWELIRGLNQHIEETKPWEIAKVNDTDHLREVLAYHVSCLIQIADLLEPFLPNAAAKIHGVFHDGMVSPLEGTLFPKHDDTEKAR